VESMPEFPGGKKGLSEYFNKTLTYPRQARNQGVQGTVYLRFVIRTDGSVTDVFVVQGIGGGCDEEALRAIQSMPHWTPAKQNHQNVPVLITIPVSFRLR
ncbi:MAG: energy transducer TonB, partial [Bacteroidales bacterium]|nr:energy transducer TonB [Bacteroidales bacterium]